MKKMIVGYSMPTKEQKEDYVIKEVAYLMEVFNVDSVKVLNLDALNITANIMKTNQSKNLNLESNGYTKSEDTYSTVFHKFDDETAVASNVAFDKSTDRVIISLNF